MTNSQAAKSPEFIPESPTKPTLKKSDIECLEEHESIQDSQNLDLTDQQLPGDKEELSGSDLKSGKTVLSPINPRSNPFELTPSLDTGNLLNEFKKSPPRTLRQGQAVPVVYEEETKLDIFLTENGGLSVEFKNKFAPYLWKEELILSNSTMTHITSAFGHEDLTSDLCKILNGCYSSFQRLDLNPVPFVRSHNYNCILFS